MKTSKILRLVCILLLACLCLVSCDDGEVYRSWEGDARPVLKEENPDSTKNEGYQKYVALTFDDGPHVTRTQTIVDALDSYGYHATFFVVGNRVDGSEYNGAAAVKYAYEHGNEIAIHAYTHELYYDNCTKSEYEAELSKTADAIKKVLPSAAPRLMRPVGGRITDERVKSSEYSVIMWSVDSEDWKAESVDEIVEKVMSEVSNGDIILMHDIHQRSADSIPLILERLHDEGYGVVTVSELIGKKLSAGKKYSSG